MMSDAQPATGEGRPGMEALTPEEREAFLARARAQGRLLTPEERARVFGAAPPPSTPPPADTVEEMATPLLGGAALAQLTANFFPELGRPVPGLRLVQGLIFDFDDTLAYLTAPLDDLMAAGAQAADAYMRSTGMELPENFWPNIVEARRFAEEKSAEEQEEHLADDAMSFLLQFFGYPASKMNPDVLKRAVDLFYAPEMTAWRLHTGAHELLQSLQGQGYQLALLANHNCDRVFQRTVDYLGLRPYFDLCLASGSVEYRKPDPKFFTIALERWGLLPYEVIVVGDSLAHDIAGGIEVGTLTVQCAFGTAPQVAHDNAMLATQIGADAVIDDLAQLSAWVQRWAYPGPNHP
jgi:putative hydrolase of the HAD superfamily